MSHVLVVDDDPITRRMCRQILESGGHTVCEAANGDEAIVSTRDTHPTVVLMDIIMPQKDGLEAIMELRSAYPRVRIVVMSGGGAIPAGKYLAITQNLGVHGVLRKPFHSKDLLDAVQNASR